MNIILDQVFIVNDIKPERVKIRHIKMIDIAFTNNSVAYTGVFIITVPFQHKSIIFAIFVWKK